LPSGWNIAVRFIDAKRLAESVREGTVLLAEAFPQIGKAKLKASTEVTIHVVRRDLLNELTRLQQSEVSAIGFQAWLQRTKDRYSNWLSRLSLHNIPQR
jgi:hypothetical protein